ncbi:hypothetical protein O988_09111 [Pseudogymnoascus sp. VKM F-3808]|nr:hypothetical protein O988_09111 [Pseudogymnoascus sp. VKM F-3808]
MSQVRPCHSVLQRRVGPPSEAADIKSRIHSHTTRHAALRWSLSQRAVNFGHKAEITWFRLPLFLRNPQNFQVVYMEGTITKQAHSQLPWDLQVPYMEGMITKRASIAASSQSASVLYMEGMIIKQAPIAASSEPSRHIYGKNDYQAEPRSQIPGEFIPWHISPGDWSFTGISCKGQNRSNNELAEESCKVGEAFEQNDKSNTSCPSN